jgi:nitrogen-specific signal transduction histidine kinase
VREPLLVLDKDLKVSSANQAFFRTFKVSPDETLARRIYDLGNHQWDIPSLRKLLEEILPRNSSFSDFEVEHEFQRIGRKKMLVNARKVENDNSQMILLAMEEMKDGS